MKTLKNILIPVFVLGVISYACSRTAGSRYIDLNSGTRVELVEDEKSGLMVNAEDGKPLYMYVDTETNDTIYGSTGEVINGYVVRMDDGSYRYKGDYKYKGKDEQGDYKVKVDGEEFKIKSENEKYKVEGDEKKIKTDNKKIKIDEDGKKVKYDD
jgi:hypothetical protein